MDNSSEKVRVFQGSSPIILSVALVIAALVFGSSWLIPLAIAFIIWILLEAVIDNVTRIGLGRFHLPRWFGLIVALTFVALIVFITSEIISGQLGAIESVWPNYVDRMQVIIGNLSKWIGPERSAKILDWWGQVNFLNQVPTFVGSARSFFSTLILIIIYVSFLLVERGHIAKKISALVLSSEQYDKVNAVLESVSYGLQRYILIKTLMSLITALLSYALFRYLEVDFAETWAFLIFLLNYIPTFGSILGVVFPALLALVQFDTIGPFVTIAIGLTAIQFIIGNVLDPMMMGKSLNMSSLAIILSLTLWGTLWGIIGMFLSVPLTIMLMIIASNVPGWRWISVLLSKDGNFLPPSPN